MEIKLVKFGTTLVFRDRGREAFTVFKPNMEGIQESEDVTVDFAGVLTFSPSWGDEFLTPLFEKYGKRLFLKNTSNSSVKATLKILSSAKGLNFNLLD